MSNFQPGVRVARISRYGHINSDTIAKVYKNGNFTLTSDQTGQQYRPSSQHVAYQTGNGYKIDHVEIWTPEIDERIANEIARKKNSAELYMVQQAVAKIFDSVESQPLVQELMKVMVGSTLARGLRYLDR